MGRLRDADKYHGDHCENGISITRIVDRSRGLIGWIRIGSLRKTANRVWRHVNGIRAFVSANESHGADYCTDEFSIGASACTSLRNTFLRTTNNIVTSKKIEQRRCTRSSGPPSITNVFVHVCTRLGTDHVTYIIKTARSSLDLCIIVCKTMGNVIRGYRYVSKKKKKKRID